MRQIVKKVVKTGLQIAGLAAWATAWIGGGLWLAYLGTRPEQERTSDDQDQEDADQPE
jgi:hypothetical protein